MDSSTFPALVQSMKNCNRDTASDTIFCFFLSGEPGHTLVWCRARMLVLLILAMWTQYAPIPPPYLSLCYWNIANSRTEHARCIVFHCIPCCMKERQLSCVSRIHMKVDGRLIESNQDQKTSRNGYSLINSDLQFIIQFPSMSPKDFRLRFILI